MGYGVWTRFGHGSCEGYAMEIGTLLRFAVIRQRPEPANEAADLWCVSLGSRGLGSFKAFDEAIAKADSELRAEMASTLADWERYLAADPPKRRIGRNRR